MEMNLTAAKVLLGMRSQIAYCDVICIHTKGLSGKTSPYKHICQGGFHSLWHYLVTRS